MMTDRCQLCVFVLALLLLSVAPQQAVGQGWLQTAQLEAEIAQSEGTGILLDSLTTVLSRRDTLTVVRKPDSSAERSFSNLRTRLIETSGIGFGSATHVRIDYRFEIHNRGYQESIEGIHFVYRPSDPEQEPIPLLYVNGQQPWVRAVLKARAIPTGGSCVPPRAIQTELTFARLQKDAKIIKITGHDVRHGFEEQKRALVEKILRLTYESM